MQWVSKSLQILKYPYLYFILFLFLFCCSGREIVKKNKFSWILSYFKHPCWTTWVKPFKIKKKFLWLVKTENLNYTKTGIPNWFLCIIYYILEFFFSHAEFHLLLKQPFHQIPLVSISIATTVWNIFYYCCNWLYIILDYCKFRGDNYSNYRLHF